MRLVRSIVYALTVASLLALLAACGGKPVAFTDLPQHPNAAPLERGVNGMADTLATTLESSLGERGTVELKLYSMPSDIAWEEVDSFYATSLAESDWKAAEELRQEGEMINTVGWTRGSLASEQGLVVGYAPNLLGDGAFLIVALFSE